MQTLLDLLSRLHSNEVEFVLVGGMAGVVHGCTIVTEDLDVCAPFTPKNVTRLLSALDGLAPRHRMSPKKPPLGTDVAALSRFQNIYLVTEIGQFDILSSVDGVGDYEAVHEHSISVEVGENRYRVLDIETLILAKEATGRPKDVQQIVQLKAIRARFLKEDSG